MSSQLPVVVIGAGPVGLAAAAHLLERGLRPQVFEVGVAAGSAMSRWAHVRMFSPWRYAIDRAAAAILERHGWRSPQVERFPTGGEVVSEYLRPLAETPEIAPHVSYGARVIAVSRRHRDRMKNGAREDAPFVVRYRDPHGEHDVLARAVIDASGTLSTPNPLGASGLPALGEQELQAWIHYGIPDVLDRDRGRYAGQRTLVVGSGHSAFNVLADLATLAEQAAGTHVHWAIRQSSLQRVFGGGERDQLQERGRLGRAIADLVERERLTVHTGFHLERVIRDAAGIVAYDDRIALPPVDRIVAATGYRPDTRLLSELRIATDLGTESPIALAPLIDPNLHSCGTVRPHGAEQLQHPDPGVFVIGMKSYGRAPTFLLLTGYEQARSVVAAIAGDWDAARRVELVLPETGVCNTDFATTESGCCGGPPKNDAQACCVRDEQAKASGARGCGCGSRAAA